MELIERDVKQLNFSFLMLCREVARQDRVIATEKFGFSRKTIDRIARAELADLKRLADNPSFLFQPRNTVGMDVLMTAILTRGVSDEQVETLRAASALADDRAREASA